MTRKIGIAILSGAVGAVIGLVVYAAVLIPAIAARADLPHVYTAKELLALPEGQLIYPGSTVIHEREQDMVPESIAPEQPALVERELAFTGSPAEVMPGIATSWSLRAGHHRGSRNQAPTHGRRDA